MGTSRVPNWGFPVLEEKLLRPKKRSAAESGIRTAPSVRVESGIPNSKLERDEVFFRRARVVQLSLINQHTACELYGRGRSKVLFWLPIHPKIGQKEGHPNCL